jgi:hypothetical protein
VNRSIKPPLGRLGSPPSTKSMSGAVVPDLLAQHGGLAVTGYRGLPLRSAAGDGVPQRRQRRCHVAARGPFSSFSPSMVHLILVDVAACFSAGLAAGFSGAFVTGAFLAGAVFVVVVVVI